MDSSGDPIKSLEIPLTEQNSFGTWFDPIIDQYWSDLYRGKITTPRLAYRYVSVLRRCLGILCDIYACTPIVVRQDKDTIPVSETRFAKYFRRPSPNKSWQRLMREYVLGRYLTGNAFMLHWPFAERLYAGHGFDTYPLPMGGQILAEDITGWRWIRYNGQTMDFTAESVWNWVGNAVDPQYSDWRGYPELLAGLHDIQSAYAVVLLGLSMATNRPRISGILSLPEDTLPTEVDKANNDFKERFSDPNSAYGVYVTRQGKQGAKYDPMPFDKRNDEYSALEVPVLRRIHALLGIPALLTGFYQEQDKRDAEAIKAQLEGFFNFTIEPGWQEMEAGLNELLNGQPGRQTICFDRQFWPTILRQTIDRLDAMKESVHFGMAFTDAAKIARVDVPDRKEYQYGYRQDQERTTNFIVDRDQYLVSLPDKGISLTKGGGSGGTSGTSGVPGEGKKQDTAPAPSAKSLEDDLIALDRQVLNRSRYRSFLKNFEFES